MEKYVIEKLDEIRIRNRDLISLDEGHQKLLAIFGFAYNEIAFLMRLCVSITRSEKDYRDWEIQQLNLSQKLCLYRILSAKLLEFHKIVQKNSKETILQKHIVEFNKLKKHPGYMVSQKIRNHVTNHYLLEAMDDVGEDFDSYRGFPIFTHSLQGNTFFPAAESVVFISAIRRLYGGNLSDSDIAEKFDDWFDWTLSAQRWAFDLIGNFYNEQIIIPHKVEGRSKTYFLPPDSTVDRDNFSLPMFIRK